MDEIFLKVGALTICRRAFPSRLFLTGTLRILYLGFEGLKTGITMDFVTNDVLILRNQPVLNLVNQTHKTIKEEHSHNIRNTQSYTALYLTQGKHLSQWYRTFCRWLLKISAHTLNRSIGWWDFCRYNWSNDLRPEAHTASEKYSFPLIFYFRLLVIIVSRRKAKFYPM